VIPAGVVCPSCIHVIGLAHVYIGQFTRLNRRSNFPSRTYVPPYDIAYRTKPLGDKVNRSYVCQPPVNKDCGKPLYLFLKDHREESMDMLTTVKDKYFRKGIKSMLLKFTLLIGLLFSSYVAVCQSDPKIPTQLTQERRENADATNEEQPSRDENNLIAEVLAAGIGSDHAMKYFETEFEAIKSIYGIAIGVIAFVVTVSGFLGYKSVRDIRKDLQDDVNGIRAEVRRDAQELREDTNKRRSEVEQLTVTTRQNLTELRRSLEEEFKLKTQELKNQYDKEIEEIRAAEVTHQNAVNNEFKALKNKSQEEFDEAVRISDCYATVVNFDCLKRFVDSVTELKEGEYKSILEPARQKLQASLSMLSKIINYRETADGDSKDLIKLYGLRALLEKRLEKFTEALISSEKALILAPKIDDTPHKAVCHYNAACYASLCNLKEKALDYLEEAIKLKLDLRESARKEPDLRNIADEPRFSVIASS
jgi:tetratricopeptide (TPR) repeat protein